MSVPWSEIAAHRERLVRVAMRRVPSREDAEDVVSEAMLRCATFADLDPARLGQFLTAVTIRLCADLYRDNERGLRLVRRLDLQDEPSPEELACAAADAEALHAVLRSLPDRQREVLIERAQGLSVTQISRRHSLTYKAAESALSRARAQVRVALAAAMSLMWAFADFLRRRPVVETSVPVATVAVAATVLAPLVAHGGPVPSADPRASAPRPPAVARLDAAHGNAAGAAQAATFGVRRTPAPPRPTDRPKPHPAPRPTPKPTYTYVEIGEGNERTVVSDDDDTLREEIQTCLDNGPRVSASPATSPPFVQSYVGCDPR